MYPFAFQFLSSLCLIITPLHIATPTNCQGRQIASSDHTRTRRWAWATQLSSLMVIGEWYGQPVLCVTPGRILVCWKLWEVSGASPSMDSYLVYQILTFPIGMCDVGRHKRMRGRPSQISVVLAGKILSSFS